MSDLLADGSSAADAPDRVHIDPSNPTIRWRYSCPNGHTTIEPTNGGIWCRSCARNPEIDDPHHYKIIDRREDREIPWSAVDWKDSPRRV